MANNPYVNKVVFGSTTLIDITDTTAVASDVASGKYFYTADGARVQGTASGGGGGTDVEDSIVTRTISGSYTNSRVTKVGSYAFAYCSSLTAASFPECTTIGSSAFYYCSSLTAASFPKCTTIGTSAFAACNSLTAASFPECTTIGTNAFVNCYRLTTASFPVCTTIGSSAFSGCDRLTAASFPACTTIGGYAFYNCTSITAISFPVCTMISNYAFGYCSRLTAASFPECTTISGGTFANCSSLATVSFPACTAINSSYTFRSCRKLLSAYFLGSSVPTLSNSNVFSSTPIGGYTASTSGVYGSIYVRASLLTSFQSATNWTYYSSRMVGLTDAQIAAL